MVALRFQVKTHTFISIYLHIYKLLCFYDIRVVPIAWASHRNLILTLIECILAIHFYSLFSNIWIIWTGFLKSVSNKDPFQIRITGVHPLRVLVGLGPGPTPVIETEDTCSSDNHLQQQITYKWMGGKSRRSHTNYEWFIAISYLIMF